MAAVAQCSDSKEQENQLRAVIESINLSYSNAADHRLSESDDQQFRCGYDCNFYEDMREACPFSFWECDPEKIHILLGIFKHNND